jgi:RNA polymerase sigma-70 factor (ECF subfamily)
LQSGRVSEEDVRDIRASLGGDEVAYARVVQRYENLVAAQMRRYTRNPQILDELVQEVFVEVYFSLARFQGQAPLLHWIRRIATRVGYRFWKLKARDQQRFGSLVDQQKDVYIKPHSVTPSEAGEYLMRLLEELPPQDRVVLTLLYFEECDTREIAERMGWTRTLVKVRAFRARQKLRVMLEHKGFGKSDDEQSTE